MGPLGGDWAFKCQVPAHVRAGKGCLPRLDDRHCSLALCHLQAPVKWHVQPPSRGPEHGTSLICRAWPLLP